MNEPKLEALSERVCPALAEFFNRETDAYYCTLAFTDALGRVRSFLVTEETAHSPILVNRGEYEDLERTKELEAEAAEAKLLRIQLRDESYLADELEASLRLLRERVESLEGALQRMVYRTEQFLDEMEKRSVRMPMWKVMTIQEALRLARDALSQASAQAEPETRSEEEAK